MAMELLLRYVTQNIGDSQMGRDRHVHGAGAWVAFSHPL